MDNCPACKHEFRGIEDFPRVRVLGVETGDLEKLVGLMLMRSDRTNIAGTNERLSAEEWKLFQRAESAFSDSQNVKKDGYGEYVEIGNFKDIIDVLEQASKQLIPNMPVAAKFREGRLYREPVMEEPRAPHLSGYGPVLPPPDWAYAAQPSSELPVIRSPKLPTSSQPQPYVLDISESNEPPPPPPAEPLPQKQIGWKYSFANSPDKLMAQLTAYVSRLESLVGTVVEPKELLKAEFERAVVFSEVCDYETKEMTMPDGTKIMREDGKPMLLRTKKSPHKSPRETGIHFGEYVSISGMGGYSRTGSPIVTIKYEGVLDLPPPEKIYLERPPAPREIPRAIMC